MHRYYDNDNDDYENNNHTNKTFSLRNYAIPTSLSRHKVLSLIHFLHTIVLRIIIAAVQLFSECSPIDYVELNNSS